MHQRRAEAQPQLLQVACHRPHAGGNQAAQLLLLCAACIRSTAKHAEFQIQLPHVRPVASQPGQQRARRSGCAAEALADAHGAQQLWGEAQLAEAAAHKARVGEPGTQDAEEAKQEKDYVRTWAEAAGRD